MQRDDLSTDAEMLASMLASVEANAAVSASGLYLFPHDLCLDTAVDQHQQQPTADQLIGPISIEHRLRQSRDFPRFETKAGIPP